MSTAVADSPVFRATLPGGESHRIQADDEAAARRLLRTKLEVGRLPAGVTFEPYVPAGPTQDAEATLKVPDLSDVTRPAKSGKGSKAAWKEFPPAEKARHLLDHQTLPDRSWTDEARLPKESRAEFIVRVLGDPA